VNATDEQTGVRPTIRLVYVAAFATEEGENLNDVESGSKDSILGAALVQYKYPAGPDGETAVELAVATAEPCAAGPPPPRRHPAMPVPGGAEGRVGGKAFDQMAGELKA
jgi:hypothetical protein